MPDNDNINDNEQTTEQTAQTETGTKNEPTARPKSHAEKMLDIIESAIEGRLSDDYKTLKINNREITKHSFDELRRIRDYYRAEVARERMRAKRKFRNYRFKF